MRKSQEFLDFLDKVFAIALFHDIAVHTVINDFLATAAVRSDDRASTGAAFQEYIAKRIEPTWLDKVNELKTRLQRGKEISEQINILGDDGVPVEYHVTFWKAELIDFVILQQDAFDEIDAVTPLERQEEIMNLVIDICHTEFKFEVFNEVMDYFKRMINIGKQMNYAPFKSEKYYDYKEQMLDLLKERAISESVSKLLK